MPFLIAKLRDISINLMLKNMFSMPLKMLKIISKDYNFKIFQGGHAPRPQSLFWVWCVLRTYKVKYETLASPDVLYDRHADSHSNVFPSIFFHSTPSPIPSRCFVICVPHSQPPTGVKAALTPHLFRFFPPREEAVISMTSKNIMSLLTTAKARVSALFPPSVRLLASREYKMKRIKVLHVGVDWTFCASRMPV